MPHACKHIPRPTVTNATATFFFEQYWFVPDDDGKGHTSVRGIGFQCPLCVVRPGSSPIPADAAPRLAVAGPSAYGAGRSERCIAADVGDSVTGRR